MRLDLKVHHSREFKIERVSHDTQAEERNVVADMEIRF